MASWLCPLYGGSEECSRRASCGGSMDGCGACVVGSLVDGSGAGTSGKGARLAASRWADVQNLLRTGAYMARGGG